jgi:hypothetical protein
MKKEQTLEGSRTPDIYISEKCCATVFVCQLHANNSTPTDHNFFQSFNLIFKVLSTD